MEDDLADGIRGAMTIGRWDLVAQLAQELERRRAQKEVARTDANGVVPDGRRARG